MIDILGFKKARLAMNVKLLGLAFFRNVWYNSHRAAIIQGILMAAYGEANYTMINMV